MALKQGAIYITPDGRRFRAELYTHRRSELQLWRLVPIDVADAESQGAIDMLFVGRGRVVRIDITAPALVADTGWTVAHLRREG
jgi:hypothetical protein